MTTKSNKFANLSKYAQLLKRDKFLNQMDNNAKK